MKVSGVVILILAAVYFQDARSSSCSCEVSYEPVGCYKDEGGNRAMPDYIMTERDRSIKIWNGYKVDWKNFHQYLPQFTCRCAKKAASLGHSYFGLQFWGECWSSANAKDTYDKHGEETELYVDSKKKKRGCVGTDYKQCNLKKKLHCVGREFTNYVYKLASTCSNQVERVGCFKDVRKNRALQNQIVTDRDRKHANYSGTNINWLWFQNYFQSDFLCRCAEAAKKEGYRVFGMQYYGECWGMDGGLDSYYKHSTSSACIDNCYQKCESSSKYCIGKNNANFVYRFGLSEGECAVPHEPVGCYEETDENRIMNDLLLTDYDPISNVFTGYSHIEVPPQPMDQRFPELACSCAFKAKQKGYEYFGLKSTGECYGGNDSGQDRALSSHCYSDYNDTVECTEEDNFCGGGSDALWVSRLVTTEVDVKRAVHIESKDDFFDKLDYPDWQ